MREEKKTENCTFKVPESWKEQILAIAHLKGMSESDLLRENIRHLLEEYKTTVHTLLPVFPIDNVSNVSDVSKKKRPMFLAVSN